MLQKWCKKDEFVSAEINENNNVTPARKLFDWNITAEELLYVSMLAC